MHRNTFINSPALLEPTLQFKQNPILFAAGQITGVEGYMESAATGIFAGMNAVSLIRNQPLKVLDNCTMLGALINFITDSSNNDFQPINANFGILPSLPIMIRDKKARCEEYTKRSLAAITSM
jgi:methylenetetrahydrofolate--tRNA-(uracil-5-)-methyltransferase